MPKHQELLAVEEISLDEVRGGLDTACVQHNGRIIGQSGLPLSGGGGVVRLSPMQAGPAAVALCKQGIRL